MCRRFDSVPRHLWGSSEVWLNATVCKTVPSGSVVRIHSPPFYRDIVKRYNYGLQNRHCGFDSYYPCSTEYFGGIGEVWLTHRFVGPTCVGSNPTYRPFIQQSTKCWIVWTKRSGTIWWYSQVVRHRSAKPRSPVQIRLPPFSKDLCLCGGIGRRAGLKIQFPLRECGFDPHRRH